MIDRIYWQLSSLIRTYWEEHIGSVYCLLSCCWKHILKPTDHCYRPSLLVITFSQKYLFIFVFIQAGYFNNSPSTVSHYVRGVNSQIFLVGLLPNSRPNKTLPVVSASYHVSGMTFMSSWRNWPGQFTLYQL